MPLNRPDMIRNAALYCAGLYWMTCQPASTTITVMKLFRMMNGIEIPSTPRW